MRNPRGAIGAVLLSLAAFTSQGADYLVGEVKALKRVTVSAQSSGVVADYLVQIGDRVQSGSALLQLDKRDARLAVELAQAQVDLSAAEYQSQHKQLTRLKELAGRRSLSESELDEQSRITQVSKAKLELDRRALAQARRELEKTQLLAPFDGWVAARHAELGQWVNLGDPLYELVQLDRVKVQLLLIEEDKVALSIGQPLTVRLPALDASVTGRVARIAPAMEAGSHGYLAELELTNDKLTILPGFRAEVLLEVGQ
ncbi:efflux RND transporter periplasmic adaptor subunit [Ferrimonas sp. YFM]|uniref:efflux RND transporter periplasmic adaptor subunit n=1 Tax=Ferrimonas sp. YFM TaxID=3028878 RepID=UPI002573E242|nr:efflux RND transporter periplasmic adaptor subunit [Ferrimonas sp. YFM]BDY04498.1 hypothetical protein F0521_15390 [Ferrimonas sp. YFM]